MTTVPHLRFPFNLAPNGSAEVLEQDVLDEVAQCVRVLLMTRVGQRIEVPEYGIVDPAFLVDLDIGGLISEITEWEPRASALAGDAYDTLDEMIRELRVLVAGTD